MKRIHLFEIEDQKWFPSFLRNYVTDFLQFLANKAKVYEPVVDEITQLIEKSNTSHIIDLGSGSGGGLLWLGNALYEKNKDTKITLTDLYPNIASFRHVTKSSPVFTYYDQPVDATAVPGDLKGIRTMFLSFHHLQPDGALEVLQNAVDMHQPVAVFEIQDRSLPSFLAMILSPVSVLVCTPFIKPFRFGRLLFTYLIPVVPLIVLWDGLVSCLRTYSVAEMKTLVGQTKKKSNIVGNLSKRNPKRVLLFIPSEFPKIKMIFNKKKPRCSQRGFGFEH